MATEPKTPVRDDERDASEWASNDRMFTCDPEMAFIAGRQGMYSRAEVDQMIAEKVKERDAEICELIKKESLLSDNPFTQKSFSNLFREILRAPAAKEGGGEK